MANAIYAICHGRGKIVCACGTFRKRGKMKRLLCVAVLLGACGDDAPKCEVPSGAWQIRYIETSGDCETGDALDQLVPFTGERASLEGTPPNCTGTRTLSDDNCEWTIALKCDLIDANGQKIGTERNVTEVNFVADDRLEGVAERSFDFGAEGSCSSQFDVIGTPR